MTTTLPSGLTYEDTTLGTGAEAVAGKRVRVHYTGWLHDPMASNSRGTKFDSSRDREPLQPARFQPAMEHSCGQSAQRSLAYEYSRG